MDSGLERPIRIACSQVLVCARMHFEEIEREDFVGGLRKGWLRSIRDFLRAEHEEEDAMMQVKSVRDMIKICIHQW